MGAVEHLKTLCCLGLKPESAMVAVTPLLHEIVPHGWSRGWLCHPDGSVGSTYAENPGTAALYRERIWSLMNDPSGILSLYIPAFRAIGIGMQVSTAYGVLTLEAKWLVPAVTLPADAARDPKGCLISVTIELHEHPVAYAACMFRESGATPAQTKVGIQLALGKTKPTIADELGVQLSAVESLTKKLYQSLDVHNSAELATKIWLGQKQDEARQYLRRAG